MAIDTQGGLWFFGQKSSVGLKSDDIFEENLDKQLQPIKLEWPPNLKHEPFKFVTCGVDHNFAITLSDKIYGFGLNKPHFKIAKSQKDLMYFQPLDVDDRVSYATCGA